MIFPNFGFQVPNEATKTSTKTPNFDLQVSHSSPLQLREEKEMIHFLFRRHSGAQIRTPPFFLRSSHRKAAKPKPPPSPPKPPQKPVEITMHGDTWRDPYSWMMDVQDRVAMRHLEMYLEQEDKYTDAVMAPTARLQSKLQSEMSVRMASDLCSPPVRWGPWLYYRRVEEGKQFPVLCRRSARLQEEFITHTTAESGFDFDSGKTIEQKLIDYNSEAERFGGLAHEERSEVSPDHQYLAYTMYDKDKDAFTLCLRDLNTGLLFDYPSADRVAQLAWAMDGKALLYTVRDKDNRPYRVYCSFIGCSGSDTIILEESDETVYVNIRNTKDFRFVTVNKFSNTFSKVYLINAADPLSGMTLVWECDEFADCVIEHHQGCLYLFTDAPKHGQSCDSHYLLRSNVDILGSRTWENVICEEPGIYMEDADFCNTHLVLVLRDGIKYRMCSIPLATLMNSKEPLYLTTIQPCFLPLPEHVCQISPGPNYDFYSSTMRFVISSPVMPDAVVDYNLLNGSWKIVQQQNLLYESTQALYGTSVANAKEKSLIVKVRSSSASNSWNDLSEFYDCENYDVLSKDGVMVPLTVVYSKKQNHEGNPGLLHVHGAYGEILDKRWHSELKSLLDRGWVVAYADVRGGGGYGKKWHHDGRRIKKQNSVFDYVSCAEFLIKKGIVQENKLAGWGYSAGGLLVASAINACPDLFRAAVLKVPILDPCSTLQSPILPLNPADYEEFGYPEDLEDFRAIRRYSPYDNIQKDTLYPAVLVTSSFNTRFGIWEAAKWVARIRELTGHDPQHPVLLNITMDMMEESNYLQSKELALETAFLIKMVTGS